MQHMMMTDFERYVNGSKDIQELEERMKAYHRNLMKNRYD